MSRKSLVFVSAVLVLMSARGLWAADPHVSNVRASQLQDGTKRVEVLYDLSGAPAGGATVSIAFSDNGGTPYDITPQAGALSGAIGAGVSSGANKRILWNAAATLPAETYGTNFRAAVTANEPAGQTGDISFRLQWSGRQDLDLYVREPSGEVIYWGNLVSDTGGQLDVDANYPCEDQSVNPTENIFWPVGQAPSGTYEYWVNLYDECAKTTAVSYRIDVLVGTDIVETQTGILTSVGEESPVYSQAYSGGGVGGDTITITLPGGVTMDLVHIPAGTFMMGSPSDERGRDTDEDPHQVTLTAGYYLGKTEVTQAQWEAVMGSNPAHDYGVGPDYPVYFVSWEDICGGSTGWDCNSSSFVGKLNAYLGTNAFRLPTEAEWERAARGGTQTAFSFATSTNPDWDTYCGSFSEAVPYMWWCGNNDPSGSKPVGSRLPNPYGLYDMHGNLFEWVADWYTSSLGTSSQTNPSGPTSGSNRVYRGGYWFQFAKFCRSAFRSGGAPSDNDLSRGFRLAKSE